MATRKTVDQILDKAADILEKDGWVTSACYDSETGGFCALGAIYRAAHPKVAKSKIDDFAYDLGDSSPRYAEAVRFLAGTLPAQGNATAEGKVFSFNDRQPHGSEALRNKSAKKIVAKLRKAAEKYRKIQAD